LAVLHTAVTSASKCLASCIAAVPTDPEMPGTAVSVMLAVADASAAAQPRQEAERP
jgi:hypothetical protein